MASRDGEHFTGRFVADELRFETIEAAF